MTSVQPQEITGTVHGASQVLVPVAAMVLLAVLDLVGVVLARQWADHRSLVSLAGGVVVFAVLFGVYAASLDYAEMATVTFGWVVMLQVGVIGLERFHHGASIGSDRLAVMVTILVLQGYLILTSASTAG